MSALPQSTAPLVPLTHFLRRPGERSLLRFSTAGSVDDGKSTLIGRLLHDTNGAYEDQVEAVRKSPINRSSGTFDFSLLTDGLRAEREQGITIDVAWRYFSTPRRSFIIADTPGHEQYTPNMATGASTSEVAVILVDARKGIQPQSRRHACISALLGVSHLVVAVNKMDLVGYEQAPFDAIVADFQSLSPKLRGARLSFIPVSALEGDNVVTRSSRMPWYDGPSLLEFLETVEPQEAFFDTPFRMPVQYVIRPHQEFRGFAGRIESGSLRPGDEVLALPSGRSSRVARIVTFEGDLAEAHAPMSVTLTLADEIDISRGALLASPQRPPHLSRFFDAHLIWMQTAPLDRQSVYLLRHGPQEVQARVLAVRHLVHVDTLNAVPASSLGWNEIGLVSLETAAPLAFDLYRKVRSTGSFILIDPLSNRTIAAGMIEGVGEDPAARIRAAKKVSFHTGPLTLAERRRRSGHAGCLIQADPNAEAAILLERRLFERGAEVLRLAEPVQPLAPLLAAGMVVIAPSGQDAPGYPALSLPSGASTPAEAAVRETLAAMVAMGVLDDRDTVAQGEGI